jgi:hypothetical protein
MHVLSGPGHHALRRGIAQAALALVLITIAPAAGVQWVLWVMVGSSVLVATAALLVIWPAEHRGDAPQTRASSPQDGGSHDQSYPDR